MGLCGSKKQPNIEKRKDSYAEGKENISSNTFPTEMETNSITFKVIIRNCKVRGMNQPLKLEINFGKNKTFSTALTAAISGIHEWYDQFEFEYTTFIHEIQKEFLTVNAVETNTNVAGTFSCNIFKIAVGPAHVDHALKKNRASSAMVGRFLCDVKISQMFLIKIQAGEIKFRTYDNLLHPKCSYTIKLKDTVNHYESQHSKEIDNPYIQQASLQNSSPANQKMIIFEKDPVNNPLIEAEISALHLTKISLQILLWEISTNSESSNENLQYNLFGETHISLAKLYHDELLKQEDVKSNFLIHCPEKKIIKSNLWFNGSKIGELEAEIIINNPPFLKHIVCGVLTENGIQKAMVFMEQTSKETALKMKTHFETMAKFMQNLPEKLLILQKSSSKPLGLENDIYNEFQKITQVIKASDKKSILSFMYKSQLELIKAQSIFISFGEFLVEYWEAIPETCITFFYESFGGLLSRGELDLPLLGFHQDDSGLNLSQNLINMKEEVANKFDRFLKILLRKALKTLDQKDLAEIERKFFENFLAFAYIRIPAFRSHLLKTCLGNDNIKIEEWRSTEYDIHDDAQEMQDLRQFSNYFDWEQGFYDRLTKHTMDNHYKEYDAILLNTKTYVQKMARRGPVFYFFVKELCDYVRKLIVNIDGIPWQSIPGYRPLLRVVLWELKNKDIPLISEPMKLAYKSLLHNQNLLNIFCSILYRKANLYENQGVFITFELMNDWFDHLKKIGARIPSNFDFHYLIKGIFLVMNHEHALCAAKALWFVYNHFDLFPNLIKTEIIEKIMSSLFIKMYLHWSFDVRQVFYHFILFRMKPYLTIYQEILNLPKTITLEEIFEKINNEKKIEILSSLNCARLNFELRKCLYLMEATKKAQDDVNNLQILQHKIKSRTQKNKVGAEKNKVLSRRLSTATPAYIAEMQQFLNADQSSKDSNKIKIDQNFAEDGAGIRHVDKVNPESSDQLKLKKKNILMNKDKEYCVSKELIVYIKLSISEYELVSKLARAWEDSKLRLLKPGIKMEELNNQGIPILIVNIPRDDQEGMLMKVDDW